MVMAIKPLRQVLILFILLLVAQTAAAKLFYRYIGAHGTPVLDDKMPAVEYIKNGYSVVNEQGIVVEVVSPQKTATQQAVEAAAIKEKKRQETAQRERAMHDSVLMGTYLSVRDILAVRDRKLAALDTLIDITRSNVTRLEDQIINLRRQATALERAGRPVPPSYQETLTNTSRQIQESRAAVHSRYLEQQMISLRAAIDAALFEQLSRREPGATPEVNLSTLMGIVDCDNKEQCQIAWQSAKVYVQKHTQQPIYLSNEQFIMTEPATKPNEVSITVGRVIIQEKQGKLVLLTGCVHGPVGDAFCKTPAVKAIQNDFAQFIKGNQQQ
jgi:hypothetical protein